MPNPVRWTQTIRLLVSEGATKYIETGAGSVLTGLLRNIDSTCAAAKFGEAADWEKLSLGLQ